ncbi:serine hydrolase domain-containing protein [Dietzia cercidiphylli]|uniref:Serine hydrolase n=1 Tax=Dietzia cercidiphylli TaxID=498199 RepID=A0ABN2IJC9_9ACTN|nr:serine hydrolase domain-containing protein [Dietzia cercidiphylli]MBB1047069.1 beta-lactamase family protein [Dietzia cercidiphylli]
MERFASVTGELDTLVDSGRLTGYVCGIRENGRSRIAAGGTRSRGGPALDEDAVFPLSSTTKPVGGVLALRLVELGILALDDPVAILLPELSAPRVLTRPDGPIDRTVPAGRQITLRHLLTMTAGVGWAGAGSPLTDAMSERQVAPGPYAPPMEPDEYLRLLGGLPLVDQPGRGWHYHTSSDVLGVLLARATGATVSGLVAEHVTGPLGLADCDFTADPDRIPTCYGLGPDGGLRSLDIRSMFAHPPRFESLACGLASTVADYLAFLDILVDGGIVLGPEYVEEMTTDHLTPRQRAGAEGFIGPGCGYGMQVEIRPDGVVGWAGGLGTIGYVDRRTGRCAAVFTTQAFDVPGTADALDSVWALLR